MPTLAISIGVTVIPVGQTGVAAVAIALLASLAVLLSRRSAIQKTTLGAAWWWSLTALVSWSGVEIAAQLSSGSGSGLLDPLRFTAVSLSFCSVVALLGAKRPQQKAWNLVVVSLWAIVALPAAENVFLHRGQALEMGDARGWFLWILILLGPINFIPTRYWLASLILASGQIVALGQHLALLRRPVTSQLELVGLLLGAGALVIAWVASRRKSVAPNPYDAMWLDFRDTFGLLWGLRVQERVNAEAHKNGLEIELSWSGFRRPRSDEPLDEIEPTIEPELRTVFRAVLRRFVSGDWIAERIIP